LTYNRAAIDKDISIFSHLEFFNRIVGIMVSMLASSAVYRGF